MFTHYVDHCRKTLADHSRAQRFLGQNGVDQGFVSETFMLGFADGSIRDFACENEQLRAELEEAGLLRNGTDLLQGCLTIPILDENKEPVNIVGYSINAQKKERMIFLRPDGIFNAPFLKNCADVILADTPLTALMLIASDVPNTSFIFGDEKKYSRFCFENGIRNVLFTFEGSARLFHELTAGGVSARRKPVDFARLIAEKTVPAQIRSLVDEVGTETDQDLSDDTIQEIEHGFVFRLPLLTYRVIGNFTDFTMSLKVNIKATRDETVFVDSIDLFRNRDRQNFIYNLIDQFDIRDQLQLEQDLATILKVIEKHKERSESDKKSGVPELTDHQKNIGLDFLRTEDLCERIVDDYTELGYVREPKNKLLLYLVMTSRLMDSPLHALLISRSSAGKSLLAEMTERMCPPEQTLSVSDLSPQALYYYGADDLKNKFIVIGEKHGSAASEYPLRELISRKSITKAIPMKDPVSGQIKTATITVNGPISLVETSTSADVNPENLNRCFVIAIDETEEQTSHIHQVQRKNYTIEGYLTGQKHEQIVKKHVFAQRLLRKIQVFNPFAELLSFPTSKLRSRRDNEKLLRLINAICFLNQYQRKVKLLTVDSGEKIEYIECSVADYRIAYDLLSNGVLENTLDDLPRPARHLLNLVEEYLQKRAKAEGAPVERIIFERKDIREYTSWSFAQVRNNFRILKDYEYLKLIKQLNGVANQYRLAVGYASLDLLNTILSPNELEKRIRQEKRERTDSHPGEVRERAPIYSIPA
jgi:DNA primase